MQDTRESGNDSGDHGEMGALEEFREKFSVLQDEAKACGLYSVVIILDDDRLADTEQLTTSMRGCGPVIAMGMMDMAMQRLTDVTCAGGEME